jgi:hypothetical protein
MRIPFRKTQLPEKKITWTMRLAKFFSRSRSLAIFGGLVALFGGARALRRRTSNA